MDVGATVAGFAAEDDGGGTGLFVGGYVAPMMGYRYIFWTPRLRFGLARDGDGAQFGSILSPLNLRILIQW